MNPIIKQLNSISDDEIVMLISPAENLLKNDLTVLKHFSSKISNGIYITINQPYVSLKRLLKNKKINVKDLFFIDLISSTVSAKLERSNNCLFINSPTNLTELGIAIEQLIASMPKGKKFIFIDNLAAFLIYNNFNVISEFTHFLINKMRMNEVFGVLMSVEEEMGSKLINTISSFCDRVIRFKLK